MKFCTCSPGQAERYWARLSGPFLDRVDLHIEVARLKETELAGLLPAESSETIALRVNRAVARQKGRYAEGERFRYNGQLSQNQMARFCKIDEYSEAILAKAVDKLGLSARAYDRVIRIARTIADLDDRPDITATDIAEAICYRARGRAA